METIQDTGREAMVRGTVLPKDIRPTAMYPGMGTGMDMDIPGMDMETDIMGSLMDTDTLDGTGIGRKRHPYNSLKFPFPLEGVTPSPRASSRYLPDGS
jgi:hypothetical protein